MKATTTGECRQRTERSKIVFFFFRMSFFIDVTLEWNEEPAPSCIFSFLEVWRERAQREKKKKEDVFFLLFLISSRVVSRSFCLNSLSFSFPVSLSLSLSFLVPSLSLSPLNQSVWTNSKKKKPFSLI